MAKQRGLGRGLDALLMENSLETSDVPATLPIYEIENNRSQPRTDFDEEALNELTESIRLHGVLQPLLVRPVPGGRYQIVAGERRWRAARAAGLSEVPVIIRDLDDTQVMLLAMIENLQREQLNPAEEAEGYRRLRDEFGLTQEEIAEKVGKSRPSVANALRLTGLEPEIMAMLRDGSISVGHAKVILSLPEGRRMELAALCAGGISVREAEKAAKKITEEKAARPSGKDREGSNPVIAEEVRRFLTEKLGRKVKVSHSGKKGTLTLEYYGEDDLKELIKLLTGQSGE